MAVIAAVFASLVCQCSSGHLVNNCLSWALVTDMPPPVQLVMLNLQRVLAILTVLSHVPVEWSPVPVVTASMSKSSQAAPVRSQSDSYGQLPAAVRSLSTDSSL
ncbi:hypothetical protein Tco_1270152 [Tanacetum coccineum]